MLIKVAPQDDIDLEPIIRVEAQKILEREKQKSHFYSLKVVYSLF